MYLIKRVTRLYGRLSGKLVQGLVCGQKKLVAVRVQCKSIVFKKD